MTGVGGSKPAPAAAPELVEAVRREIDYCLNHDDPEGSGGFRNWMTQRILSALRAAGALKEPQNDPS